MLLATEKIPLDLLEGEKVVVCHLASDPIEGVKWHLILIESFQNQSLSDGTFFLRYYDNLKVFAQFK